MLHVYQNCFVLLAECAPPAVSSPNPDDPSGPPICADWAVGPFGRVMTNAYNIYIYHCYVSLTTAKLPHQNGLG